MAFTLVDDGSYSQRGYVAPTVFLKAGQPAITNWNFYNSLDTAAAKAAYLQSHGASGTNYDPDGGVTLQPNGTAQTVFINCDFYIPDNGQWVLCNYASIKALSTWPPYFLGTGYTADGNGPVYFIVVPANLGVAATSVSATDPATVAALDGFYREVTLLKYRYNSLAGFLNNMAMRALTPTEQQIFNEGTLKLQAMAQEMSSINGIAITWTDKGQIGNPLLLIILIVLILASATAWTITQIADEQEKTKQINDAYQLQQWVADKKTALAQMVQAGQISQADANGVNGTLDAAAAAGLNVANNAAKQTTGMFDGITNILKWGTIAFIAVKGFQLASNLRNNKTGQ